MCPSSNPTDVLSTPLLHPHLYKDGVPMYEDVLDHRPLKKGKRISWQFLIKWKGYAHEHKSWEPYDNIASKDLTLGPYWRAVGGEPL